MGRRELDNNFGEGDELPEPEELRTDPSALETAVIPTVKLESSDEDAIDTTEGAKVDLLPDKPTTETPQVKPGSK